MSVKEKKEMAWNVGTNILNVHAFSIFWTENGRS
jgi:hypothetical protein